MHSLTYPKSIYLILTIEFCERFSFCGLRTMLSLYLRDVLKFSEKDATILYHIFYALCYFVPIIGAILADSVYGRYRTIRAFSVIYVIGNILLYMGAVGSLQLPILKTTLLGLALIGIGTGGIKPCVAALCGEQFSADQRFYLERFFSVYYFIINIGGFLGMVCIPMIRKFLPGYYSYCSEPCYELGFGVSALLMILSLGMFILGKPIYTIRTPPKKNIILQFLKCMVYALNKKFACSSPDEYKSHWLDYAEDEFPPRLITDMKTVFAILFVFIPLPLFWSLFDQLGSSWTFQAARTDSQIFGLHILPDQIQVISPMLSLILIPLFDKIIYPVLDKLGILENPLRRMVCGGCIAGLAFLSAGYVELNLQGVYPASQYMRNPKLVFINTLPCSVSLVNDITYLDEMASGEMLTYANVTHGNYSFNAIAPLDCGNLVLQHKEDSELKFTLTPQPLSDSIIILSIQDQRVSYHLYEESFLPSSESHNPQLTIIAVNMNSKDLGVWLSGKKYQSMKMSKQKQSVERHEYLMNGGTSDVDVFLNQNVTDRNSSLDDAHISLIKDQINFETRGIYCYVLYLKENPLELNSRNMNVNPATPLKESRANLIDNNNKNRVLSPTIPVLHESYKINAAENPGSSSELRVMKSSTPSKYQVFSKLLVLSPGHSVKLIYMVPQYVLMSIGEVMFAIAGLHFSFTQAPRAMKTVTIAMWQLSVAIGNVVIILIEQLRGYIGQAGEFFLYACLIFLDMIFFYRITKRYRFVKMQLDESSSLLIKPGDNQSDIFFNIRS